MGFRDTINNKLRESFKVFYEFERLKFHNYVQKYYIQSLENTFGDASEWDSKFWLQIATIFRQLSDTDFKDYESNDDSDEYLQQLGSEMAQVAQERIVGERV